MLFGKLRVLYLFWVAFFLIINYRWGWFILLGWVVSCWIHLIYLHSKMVKSTRANLGFFTHDLNPEIRRIVRRLEYLHLKIIKKKQSMEFDRTCLDNNLLSKYKIYLYMYKQDLALNNLQGSLCHKTQSTMIKKF